MEQPLIQRVRTGVVLNAVSLFVAHAVALGRSVLLARLLAPDDFGLFGMALTVLAALTALTSTGLDASLLFDKFEDEAKLRAHLDTVWSAELVRRALLTALLLASVYPAARFYGDARLYLILPLVALTPLVQGFQNIGLVLLRKQVSFRRIFWFEQATNLATTAVAVVLAFWTRNVWALVLSHLFAAFAGAALSYAFHPYRPRLAFDRAVAARAFDFGKYILVIVLTAYVTTMADNVLVGRLFGATVLGVYVVAYNLASLPIGVVAGVFGGVALPAFAELRERGREQLEAAFVRTLTVASALLVLFVAPVMLLADEIVRLLYGAKWEAAGALLRVLAPVGFGRGLLQVIAPFVIALKGPRPEALMKTVEALLFLAVLYPLVRYDGARGAAWAGVFVYAVTLFNRAWLLRAHAPRAFESFPRVVLTSLFAGVVGAAAGALALAAVGDGAAARLFVGGAVCVTVTAAVLLSALPDLRGELRQAAAALRGPS